MRLLVTAKCNRCLGSATGKSFDEASANIDHAVGLTRSISCGDNYNYVVEVKSDNKTYKKVEAKSGDKIIFGEVKPTHTKKSK